MKQSYVTLVIILLVLITLILATSIALLVVVNGTSSTTEASASITVESPPSGTPLPATAISPSTTPAPFTPTPSVSSEAPSTTIPPVVTTPTPVTTSPVPITTTSASITTTTTVPTPVTTTPPIVTNEPPPVTTAPQPPAPTPTPTVGKAEGDQLGSLSIHAEYEVIENDPVTSIAKVRFTVYVNSYSLNISARSDNTMTVNGQSFTHLSTNAIQLSGITTKTTTLLYETVLEIPLTNGTIPFQVDYNWHYKGSYSGNYAEWLSVRIDLTLVP